MRRVLRTAAAIALTGLVGCDEPVNRPEDASAAKPQASPTSAQQPTVVVSPGGMDPAAQSEAILQLKAEVTALRQENASLRQELLKHNAKAAAAVPVTPYLPNKSGVPTTYTLPPDTLRPRRDDFPAPGSVLSREEFSELMTGAVQFNPGPIPSSNRPVTDETPLQAGQEIQLKWGDTWWAATITGFEEDGTVRTSYFGWDRRHDEAVPRSDLQLDTNTRERAIQGIYRHPP